MFFGNIEDLESFFAAQRSQTTNHPDWAYVNDKDLSEDLAHATA